MANGSEDTPGRVQRIEQKLDALSASVAAGLEQMDQHFHHLEAALLEQHEYPECACEKLDAKMDAGFSRLDLRMDAGVAQVDGRFAGLERKIDQLVDLHLPKTPPDRPDSE